MATADLTALDEERLAAWLLTRRWFGSKARDVSHIRVLDVVELTAPSASPEVAAALVEARFPGGTHDVYQLVVGMRPEGFADGVIDELDGTTVYDAFDDPQACLVIGALLGGEASVSGARARMDFRWVDGHEPPPRAALFKARAHLVLQAQ